MNSFKISDVGKKRVQNQDKVEIISKNKITFAILCDGMGGESGGDIASSMCIEFLKNSFKNDFSKDIEDVDYWLKNKIINSNDEILKYAGANPSLLGMGTTLVCLIILDEVCYYASVGDSRIYYYDKKEIRQISEDQTLVAALLKGGYISEKEASNHPKRNLLLSAVGSSPSDQLDIQIRRIEKKDNFLLCSDGLYNMVSKKEIFEIIKKDITIEEKAKKLVEKANDNGGMDNIAIILMEDVK